MTYQRTFKAETKEEAIKAARQFYSTLDSYTQPSIYPAFERNGEWIVTVNWYGLD